MSKRIDFMLLTIFLFCFTSCQVAEEAKAQPKNLLTDYPPINADSSLNVVIEISAGSIDKWEVNKSTGKLVSDSINGKARKIAYLPYPSNYGMIPRTLLPTEAGGDGDPLDILVLGPAIPRGEIVKCRLIGMLNLLDGGEVDDKLIGVADNSRLWQVESIEELKATYPGILEIIDIWFSNYKGKGKLQSKGFSDENSAKKMLSKSIDSFSKAND